MKLIALMLALMLVVAPAIAEHHSVVPVADGPNAALITSVYNSVALLYRQDESGGMHMTCTATAYRKTDKGYRFVSASHCVEGDTEREEKDIKFYIANDAAGAKNFIPAKLIEAGDRKVGDDFSIFEVETSDIFQVTPLGDNSTIKMGSEVIDVAAPLGLGKQFFQGYVTEPLVDRPPLDADSVQWSSIMLVMIGSGPGSSGSAIVSVDQRAIVGFLVGGFNANIGAIVVPVSKFKAFETAVDAGKYKKTSLKDSLSKSSAFALSAEQHGRGGQRGGNHGGNHGKSHGPRYSGRDSHRHLRGSEIRVRGGHRDVFFGGIWFTCGVWPEWVFASDVYFQLIDDQWYVISYDAPTLMVQVTIVE